jgi:hypothetical protein
MTLASSNGLLGTWFEHASKTVALTRSGFPEGGLGMGVERAGEVVLSLALCSGFWSRENGDLVGFGAEEWAWLSLLDALGLWDVWLSVVFG